MRVVMVKKLGSLHPTDDAGQALLRRLKQNSLVTVDVKQPRNLRFHAKLFGMLHLVLQNQEYYRSIDDILDVCKLRIGHFRTVQTKDGEVRIPMSISFASMDETAFADFYDRACGWVISEVIPGLQRGDLDEEVAAQLMDFGRPEG